LIQRIRGIFCVALVITFGYTFIVASVENGLGFAKIFVQVQEGKNRAHPEVRKAFCRRGNCAKISQK